MTEYDAECCPNGRPSKRKLFLASIVLGGSALAVAGMLLWRAAPPRRTERMLAKARRTLEEIEETLAAALES